MFESCVNLPTGNIGPLPLLGPTLVNRTSFINANAAQASTPYKPLNIYWTCDVVTFRFEIPFEPQPVLGITILETQPAPKGSKYPFQIKQVSLPPAIRKGLDYRMKLTRCRFSEN